MHAAATFPWQPWPEPWLPAQGLGLLSAKGQPAWWGVLVIWLYGLFKGGRVVVSFVCVCVCLLLLLLHGFGGLLAYFFVPFVWLGSLGEIALLYLVNHNCRPWKFKSSGSCKASYSTS